MNRKLLPYLLVSALTLAVPATGFGDADVSGAPFLLREARVFDGERMHEHMDVLVADGIIVAVGVALQAPAGTREISAMGRTLLPALLDAHTHNFGLSRVEALRFGIGTQIDMFSPTEALEPARLQRESLDPVNSADMWSAGTLVTAAGGHGTQYGLPIATLDDAREASAFIAQRVAEGSDFIKLVVESGAAWGRPSPTLDEATLAAAISAAHAHGRLAVVHASTRDEAALAVRAGADGLVHLFGDQPIDDELLDLMANRGVFIIPTLAVLESVAGRDHGLLADSRVAPWASPDQADGLRRNFGSAADRSAMLQNGLHSTARLRAAGITILAGSDAPNPGTAHGASLHRELELLVEAGLSPLEALRAATSLPARQFGIIDRGRIAPGLRADLVLIGQDPLEDITATRSIESIWKNGREVERMRFDGPIDAPPPVAGPVIGAFSSHDHGWLPTTDQMQGGRSEVSLTAADGSLALAARVAAGTPWPWAGAIRMLGEAPMAPADASAYTQLRLRLRGDGPVQVLFFSGASAQSIPVMHPVEMDGDWQDVVIPFAHLAGLDPAWLRAVAVVAGPVPGEYRIEIGRAILY